MTTNPKPHFPFEIVLLIIVLIGAIGFTLMAVGPDLLIQIARPRSTVMTPTPIITSNYQPEIIPASTDAPAATQTSTPSLTNQPIPTLISTLPPTIPITRPLPDLTVTGISDPVCAQNTHDNAIRKFVKLTVDIWNIGHGSTGHFGMFDISISLILGQMRYTLGEWATTFNGVIWSPNLTIPNLNPKRDVSLLLEIDLKGNIKFGIEATANSGTNPIPETNTTNNVLTKYFSVQCY